MTAGYPPPPPADWAARPELLPPPPTPDLLELEGVPGWAALTAAAAVGVAMDLALRSGLVGVGGALLCTLAAAGLVAAARPANPQALALAGLALLFGSWFAVRTSPWLLPLDALAASGLLALAASLARGGSFMDLRFTDVVVRSVHGLGHGVAGPGVLARAAKRVGPDKAGSAEGGGGSGRPLGVATGLLLAVPLVIVFGALLASADPVFASFFNPASLLGHAALIALGAWLAAALVRLALAKPPAPVEAGFRWLSTAGTVTVLAAVDALFAAFACAQLVASSDGGRKVIETAGLTWAEYARSGFFQLLAVASLTIVVVLTLRGWVKPGAAAGAAGRAVRWLCVLTVALTMTLVIVAYQRLDLYIDTFGLTMLRLFSSLFTIWVGVVLALLAAALVWPGRRAGDVPPRAWFGPAAVAAGLALLLGLNVVNPEALVVRHNIEAGQAAQGTRTSDAFDPDYAGHLSDDAVPAFARVIPSLAPGERQTALDQIGCGDREPAHRGWAAWNWSRSQAEAARDRVCPR